MKHIAGFMLICLLVAGCSDLRREAGGGTAVPESRANGDSAKPNGVPFRTEAELFAAIAERERMLAQSLSVPVQTPTAAETAPQEMAAVPPAAEPPRKTKSSSAAKAPSVSVQKNQSSGGKKLTLPQLLAKYPEAFKVSGASQEKNIALTFDDGPDERFTPQVLDVLKAHGVKATFFLLGKKAEAHPAIVKRIIQEGHVIGNHSYRHPLFTKITVTQFAEEVEQTEEVLNRLTGYRPKLLRPPYGEIDEEQLQWAHSHGYMIVNWNVDSLDWKNLGEQQVSGNILGHTKAGAIVLQHSAGGNSQDLSGTVKALPAVIARLREQGYGLVTVPELLHLSKSK